MDSISELEFKVQILARCMGSALGLGRPTRIEIHYCTPQNKDPVPLTRTEDQRPAAEATFAAQSSALVPKWVTGSQDRSVVCAA
ncbi:MAG: hypothetical protein Q6L68_03925 [Thermostichus sp. DG02_5_bins_236]